MAKIISGGKLSNIPWQEKPADCWLPIWRYDANPVIGRNPFPGMGRIYNSAVIPWQGKFKGVFRSEDTSARPFLYIGVCILIKPLVIVDHGLFDMRKLSE